MLLHRYWTAKLGYDLETTEAGNIPQRQRNNHSELAINVTDFMLTYAYKTRLQSRLPRALFVPADKSAHVQGEENEGYCKRTHAV